MISKKLAEAINAQINAEMWSAYLYLGMSMDATQKGMKGLAHWFNKQYGEEMEHAFKFIHYLQDHGVKVELKPIAEFPTKWANPVKMWEKTLEHEKNVTAMIHNLCEIAAKDKDYASSAFLQWYATEQIEEEADAQEHLDEYKMIGDDKAAFFMLDSKLGAR